MREVPVFVEVLALECEHCCAVRSDCSGSVVLRGVDIAGSPANLCTQRLEGLDQHGGLDRHVQRTSNACALERLAGSEFFANRHQTRHFGLSDSDFFVAPLSQTDVGNVVIDGSSSFEYGAHHALLSLNTKKVT